MATTWRLRLCRASALLAAAGGIAVVACAAWLGTGRGSRWLADRIEDAVDGATAGGHLRIDTLRPGIFRWEVEGIHLSDAEHHELLAIDRADLRVDPFALLGGALHIPEATIAGVRVEARQLPDGRIDWVALFPPSGSTEPTRSPIDIRVDALALDDVDVRFRTPESTPLQITDAWLLGRLVAHDTTFDLSDLESSLELTLPGGRSVGLWGGVQWDSERGVWLRDLELQVGDTHGTATGLVGDDWNVVVALDRITGDDVGALAGHPLGGEWSLGLSAKGPSESVEVVGALSSLQEAGSVAVLGQLDLSRDTPRWSIGAHFDQFHVEAIETSLAQPVVLAGTLQADGSGVSPTSADAAGTWRASHVSLYGQEVDALDAAFTLRDGQLDLAPSTVDGVIGSMTVSGGYSLVTGHLDVTVDSDLSPERLAALGTTGLDGNGRVRARIRQEPGAAAIHLSGTARYAPFVYGADVRVATLSAPFDLVVEQGAVRGSIDLSGTGVSAYGAAATGISGRKLRLDREADGRIGVSGTVETPGFRYGDHFVTQSASTSLKVNLAGTSRNVRATTVVGPHTIETLPGGGGVVFTEVHDDDVTARVAFGDGARATLVTVARFDLGTSELALDSLKFSPTPRATWTAVEPVTLRLADGGVADAKVHLKSEIGELEVTGALGTTGPLDGRVHLVGFELDHVTELFPDLVEIGGRLDLAMELRGTAEAPEIDAEVGLERLFAAGFVRWLDVAGKVGYRDGVVRPDLELAAVGETLAWFTGEIPLAGGLSSPTLDLDADATWKLAVVPGPVARVGTVAPSLDGTALPAGSFSASIDSSGRLGDPDLRIAAVSETPAPGFVEPARVELDLRRRADEAWFAVDVREDLGLRGAVSGRGHTRAGDVFRAATGRGPEVDTTSPEVWIDDLSAQVVLAALPLAGFGSLAGTPALGGELAGAFIVTGDPMRPEVDGGLNWVGEASFGGQTFPGGYLAITPEEGGYHLDLEAILPQDGSLTVSGSIPVAVDFAADPTTWSTAPLALEVGGAGIPMTLLGALDPELRGDAGLLEITGKVGGMLHDPKPELTLHAEGLAAVYRALNLRTKDAKIDATFASDAVHFDVFVPTSPIRQVRAFDLEPDAVPAVRLKGDVGLSEWAPTTLDVSVSLLDGAWLAATDFTKVRSSGEVTVGGEWPRLKVKGDLRLDQGLVRMEAAGTDGAGPLSLNPTLTVVRTAQAPAEPPPPPPAPLEIDALVNVELGRNLQLDLAIPFVDQLGEVGAAVSRVDVSTRVGGTVRVKAKNGSPVLVGEIELVEGTVRMMRSTFDLQEGHVAFTGGDPYEDSELDITAQMPVSGSTLDVRITGTPVQPEITLSSEAYPDFTEQMVILVTGSAPDELSADQGAGAALSMLWSSAFAGMRLGSFSIEPSGAVRLGVPVSRRVYTSTTYSLQQDPTMNQLTFEADWSLSKRIVFNGAIGDRQSWGDVYFEVKF